MHSGCEQRREALYVSAFRRQILVVDDDECMRSLLRLHLSNAGYSVVLAEDALVAGRKLLESPPDLLIVDVEMPYMSGLEFAATVIADATLPDIPILMTSAHERFAAKADLLGVSMLLKPFAKDQLLSAVGASLSMGALLAEPAGAKPQFQPKIQPFRRVSR